VWKSERHFAQPIDVGPPGDPRTASQGIEGARCVPSALRVLVLGSITMKVKRGYVMRARADRANETRQRILEAAIAELWGHRLADVRLEDIATRAEVTVQTVLRVFNTKSHLLQLGIEKLSDRVRRQRATAEPGDVEGTIRALFDHYEDMGDFVIRSLADEDSMPELRERLDTGRRVHRQSIQRQFAPQLSKVVKGDRRRTVDCLVAACDAYTWKLLRRDIGRSRGEAEACVRQMVDAILGGT